MTPSDENNGTNNVNWCVTLPEEIAEEWDASREELDMATKAEYIRSMVEAGRKQLSLVSPFESSEAGTHRDQILAILDEDEFKDWDDIRNQLVEDLEDELENELEALTQTDRVDYSPRRGWKK